MPKSPKTRKVPRVLSVLLLAGISTACQHDLEIARPPAEKLQCLDEPGRPTGQGPNGEVTDVEAAQYMTELRGAWFSCWSNVTYLRDWFEALPE